MVKEKKVEVVKRKMYKLFFIIQVDDGIRDLVRSRGLGDIYKRQPVDHSEHAALSSGRC